MKVFILIFFILLFSNSWGIFSDDEIKQAWRDTGYNFREVFKDLKKENCYESEKKFSACLMVFHRLLSIGREDESYQLRVSETDKLEIIPYSRPDHPINREEFSAMQAKRRESFRLLFKTQTPGIQTSNTQVPDRADDPLEFNNIVQQVLEFTEKVPLEDQSALAGETYNTYLGEAFDPHSSLVPKELILTSEFDKNSASIGADLRFYKTESGEITLAVFPFKDSPAREAGLRKGDLIFSIDGFDIRGLAFNEKTEEDIRLRIRGQAGTQVKIGVLSFCDNQEKEIVVSRGGTKSILDHWLITHYFVELNQQEPLDCDSGESSSETPWIEHTNQGGILAKIHSVQPQAIYLPLERFLPPLENVATQSWVQSLQPLLPGISDFPLCAEFMYLQGWDIRNSHSKGMIIDLRGNGGGYLHEVACMLNTLIQDKGALLRRLPIKDGEVSQTPDETDAIYFTEGGFYVSSRLPLITYNKNIVVLVDKYSASASEIFAGTIQDMKRGWVVGDRTIGKGSMQEITPIQMPPDPETNEPMKPLQRNQTSGIYVLNSGRSPQGYGIIPDFHISKTGESIDLGDSISLPEQLFFNSIRFENTPWEQNRPEELAQLKDCINKEGRLGFALKEKIRKEQKYKRTYAVDYQLELAKDILICAQPRPAMIPSSDLSPLYDYRFKSD